MLDTFVVAAVIGFKHALDPDHIAATFNMALSEKLNAKSSAKLGLHWGLGHAISMILLGLPIILFSAAFSPVVYSIAELAIGLIITYLGLKLFYQWFQGSFHPQKVLTTPQDTTKVHKRASLMGALHGFGGSYPAALFILSSFTSTLSAVAGLVLFSVFSIISMVVVTAAFSYAALHHSILHFLDRLLLPMLIALTLYFGVNYALEAYKVLT